MRNSIKLKFLIKCFTVSPLSGLLTMLMKRASLLFSHSVGVLHSGAPRGVQCVPETVGMAEIGESTLFSGNKP